jgi:hypothetical protein
MDAQRYLVQHMHLAIAQVCVGAAAACGSPLGVCHGIAHGQTMSWIPPVSRKRNRLVMTRAGRVELGRTSPRRVRFQHGSAAGSEPRQALRQRETPRGGASPFSRRGPSADGRHDGCDRRGSHSEMWANCSPLPLGPAWWTEAWQPEARAAQWSSPWRDASAGAAYWSGPWCRGTDRSEDAATWSAGPAQWSGPWRWNADFSWRRRAEG